jgi:hypothetical protein
MNAAHYATIWFHVMHMVHMVSLSHLTQAVQNVAARAFACKLDYPYQAPARHIADA